jgi:hypothetical protein
MVHLCVSLKAGVSSKSQSARAKEAKKAEKFLGFVSLEDNLD